MVLECADSLETAALSSEAIADIIDDAATSVPLTETEVNLAKISVEVPKTVGLCRQIEIKELNLKLSEAQRELFKAISSAERSEALRQEAALELNHAELLNKRLLFFNEQQQRHIKEAENRVKLAEERYSQCIHDWNAAKEQWEKDRTSLMEKLESAANQQEFYRRSLDDAQGQLAAALSENQALLETIDHITAELKAVTGDKGDVCALMDAKLKEEQELKLEFQEATERNRHLETELEAKQTQLTQLRETLPVLLQMALRQAVDRVHTVAKVQISKTHERLEGVEHRLWQQIRQLRELESTNRFLKGQVDWFSLHYLKDVQVSNQNALTYQTARRSQRGSNDEMSARPTDANAMCNQPHSERAYYGNSSCTLKKRQLCDQLEAILDLLPRDAMRKKSPNSPPHQRGGSHKRTRTQTALEPSSGEAGDFHHTRTPLMKKTVVNVPWSHVNMLASRIYHGLQSLNSQSSARQAALARSTAENQRLRGQLMQLKRQVTEIAPASQTRRVNQSPSRTFQISPPPQRARECCRSRSSVRHTPVDDLQKRCARALSEMSRWRRRWRGQEMALQMERKRLGVLQSNQQADLQIWKKFLTSICQLIQEASRHIDLVIQKHMGKFCSRPNTPSVPHSPTTGSPSRTVDLVNPQLHEAGQPDRPLPSPRGKMLLFSPQRNSVFLHSLELTPTGDEHSNQPINHAQPKKGVPVTNTCSIVSKCIDSSTDNRDRYTALMDTNCNNNIRTSQPFTTVFGSQNVRSSTRYKRSLWTDTSQFSLVDHFGTRASFSSLETPTKGCRMQNFSPFESTRSTLQSVATTRDPCDVDTPVGPERSTTSASPEQTPDEASDSAITPATEVVYTETSLFSSTSLSVDNTRSLAQEQLYTLRAAVRNELSKVLANVVAHAKKNDSLAQECLEAITELQMQLAHGAGSAELAEHHAVTSLSEVALSEVKWHNLQASHHLPTALGVTNKTFDAFSLNKGMLVSQSPVQISVPAEDRTPPSTSQLQTLVVPSAVPAKTTAMTNTTATASAASVSELELTVTSDPGLRLSQSSAVSSLNPTVSRRSTGSKVTQPKEKWKPVGGVIHTSQWRDAPTFGTGRTDLRMTSKQKSTDSVRHSLTTQSSTDTNPGANVCLPLVRVRREGRTDTGSGTRFRKGKDSDMRSAPPRAQSERPHAQPPPNSSLQQHSGDSAFPTQVRTLPSNLSGVRRGIRTTVGLRPIEEKMSSQAQGKAEDESNGGQSSRRFSGLLRRPRPEPRPKLDTIEDRIMAESERDHKPVDSAFVDTNIMDLMSEIQSNVNHTMIPPSSVPPSPNEWVQIESDCIPNSNLLSDSNTCCCGSSCCVAENNTSE